MENESENYSGIETPKPQRNSLLQKLKVIPPEIYRIPSGSLLYTNDEIDAGVVNGEIEFYTYSALDELDLKSPDLLLDGRAITRVVSRCAPAIHKPLELFSKDLDFVMLALHKVSYGDEFQISQEHNCENAKEHSYVVSLSSVMAQTKSIDPTTLSKLYSIKLGTGATSYNVNLRPLRAKHALDLIQSYDKQETEEERRKNLFAVFMFSISDVDGVTDVESVLEWLQQIPIKWIEQINKRIEEISNWGVPHTAEVICKDCNQPMRVNVNVNPLTFFI